MIEGFCGWCGVEGEGREAGGRLKGDGLGLGMSLGMVAELKTLGMFSWEGGFPRTVGLCRQGLLSPTHALSTWLDRRMAASQEAKRAAKKVLMVSLSAAEMAESWMWARPQRGSWHFPFA